ncbi:MAG: hypothetical protein AAGJ46_19470, partial [Planctomycetota bacterium]
KRRGIRFGLRGLLLGFSVASVALFVVTDLWQLQKARAAYELALSRWEADRVPLESVESALEGYNDTELRSLLISRWQAYANAADRSGELAERIEDQFATTTFADPSPTLSAISRLRVNRDRLLQYAR